MGRTKLFPYGDEFEVSWTEFELSPEWRREGNQGAQGQVILKIFSNSESNGVEAGRSLKPCKEKSIHIYIYLTKEEIQRATL